MNYLGQISDVIRLSTILKKKKENYLCPICNYRGPFEDIKPDTGLRKHALCPKCGALERHRLQHLVMSRLSKDHDFSRMRMINFAPEEFFRNGFKRTFGDYITADLHRNDVDFRADITKLPFRDGEHDFVFASHVLGHIRDDLTAVSEYGEYSSLTALQFFPFPSSVRKLLSTRNQTFLSRATLELRVGIFLTVIENTFLKYKSMLRAIFRSNIRPLFTKIGTMYQTRSTRCAGQWLGKNTLTWCLYVLHSGYAIERCMK